ncbi:alpha/beta fold hydrolase [Methylobacillus flagellatus]|uniref:alpha/beta fold hydrolase n=1 Tax=Methylobacillus flagellatus TaxID=405 RepID=UPI00256FCA76|nr:YqiA/YcfP family alpha/beta fold hydrolase [Methylobacillus flagellatus]
MFGGIKGALGMPPFEFYKSCSMLQESRIFFRDLSQRWYHAGLAGISNDIAGTVRYLRDTITRIQPTQVVFIGNSMGGYAAILFSNLLGIGRVVCFSPQTFITARQRLRHSDYRWQRQILSTYLTTLGQVRYFDLAEVLLHAKQATSVTIHVSNDDSLDMKHAKHLESFSNVRLCIHEAGGHGLVKHLRDSGKLHKLLLEETL